jgi:uncharacterized LabA/DUF88 family protein
MTLDSRMNRVAVFIDAGYLYASAIKLLTGIKQSRSAITLSYEDFLDYIIKQSEALTRRELLRVYWYDGTSSGPTGAHRKLAYQANVKLRLGMVSLAGEQKGVDSLLIMDMANLAQNRAMSDAVVLTGDEDIRVGVVLAQQYGVRVHLVGIADPDGERNQSSMLQQEADTTGLIGLEELQKFATVNDRSHSDDDEDYGEDAATVALIQQLMDEAAHALISTLGPEELIQARTSLGTGAQSVPPMLDRQLLTVGRQRMQRDLQPHEKRQLRARFVTQLKRAAPDPNENEAVEA